ncbi:hypothetical protein [Microbulbifer sp. A4B17]|uniref:hypothetical protein n=1 Tax=Microbulbifer sp. A4B17 TaxID=359370 RepID=UPI001300921A|nr:hypothetical protein [Microbulbifer sp. A4B17]
MNVSHNSNHTQTIYRLRSLCQLHQDAMHEVNNLPKSASADNYNPTEKFIGDHLNHISMWPESKSLDSSTMAFHVDILLGKLNSTFNINFDSGIIQNRDGNPSIKDSRIYNKESDSLLSIVTFDYSNVTFSHKHKLPASIAYKRIELVDESGTYRPNTGYGLLSSLTKHPLKLITSFTLFTTQSFRTSITTQTDTQGRVDNFTAGILNMKSTVKY